VETRFKEAKTMMGFETDKRLVIDHHNQRVTEVVGGKLCKFRSKGESRLAHYFELLKAGGLIKDWLYEKTTFIFREEIRGAKVWLVDFDVLNLDGSFEYYEYKGWLKSIDVTKFRRLAQYRPECRVTLVMSGKAGRDANRLRQVAKYAHRITFANELFRGMV
jgi:hypothetical protein